MRHDRYPALFYAPIDADGLTDIRAACHTDTPLGNDAFKAKIERKLHCQVGQARRGRPKGLTKGSDPLSLTEGIGVRSPQLLKDAVVSPDFNFEQLY